MGTKMAPVSINYAGNCVVVSKRWELVISGSMHDGIRLETTSVRPAK